MAITGNPEENFAKDVLLKLLNGEKIADPIAAEHPYLTYIIPKLEGELVIYAEELLAKEQLRSLRHTLEKTLEAITILETHRHDDACSLFLNSIQEIDAKIGSIKVNMEHHELIYERFFGNDHS